MTVGTAVADAARGSVATACASVFHAGHFAASQSNPFAGSAPGVAAARLSNDAAIARTGALHPGAATGVGSSVAGR